MSNLQEAERRVWERKATVLGIDPESNGSPKLVVDETQLPFVFSGFDVDTVELDEMGTQIAEVAVQMFGVRAVLDGSMTNLARLLRAAWYEGVMLGCQLGAMSRE